MKKKRYVSRSKIKFILVVCLFIYLIGIFTKQEFMLRDQYRQTSDLERQIDQVKKENNDLERQIQYSESKGYIERMARENLGWVREGEKVFIEDKK